MEEESAPRRSLLMPLGWVIVAMLVGLAALAGVGAAILDSESMGVLAAQVAAFPVGFSLSAALVGLIIHFGVRRATSLLRAVGPIGCGCLGGALLLGTVLGFFVVIWPSL